MAPSMVGTFLRAFTFGHVRQLKAVMGKTLRRAWALSAGPGEDRLSSTSIPPSVRWPVHQGAGLPPHP